MADFKFTIPILGKVIGYIYDFCTYKKKWNFEPILLPWKGNDNKWLFNLSFNNKTNYFVRIDKITINTGLFTEDFGVILDIAPNTKSSSISNAYIYDEEQKITPQITIHYTNLTSSPKFNLNKKKTTIYFPLTNNRGRRPLNTTVTAI